jgi:hypothetical protein
MASPRLNLMSSAEIEAILTEAESCAGGECALDEVSSLIMTLQNQQSLLSKRVGEIDGLLEVLENANGRGGADRPVDEMKETVRAIFRIFALGVSCLLCRFYTCIYRIPRPDHRPFPLLLHFFVARTVASHPPSPFPLPPAPLFYRLVIAIPNEISENRKLQDKASGNNYPKLSAPMGYSGDTKGGGKTAYDVLPPKPIKK